MGGLSNSALDSTLATTQRLVQFAAPANAEKPRSLGDAQRVVYVSGTFDLLHGGHALLLERAASLGDYVLVGLYSDEVVCKHRGQLPVLTLLERAMAVLSLRWVDDVVLGAPWEICQELLTAMNISVVISGRKPNGACVADGVDSRDALAHSLGILNEVESGSEISVAAILARFLERSPEFRQRNAK